MIFRLFKYLNKQTLLGFCLFIFFLNINAQENNKWIIHGDIVSNGFIKTIPFINLDFNQSPPQFIVDGEHNSDSNYWFDGHSSDRFNICNKKGEIVLYTYRGAFYTKDRDSIAQMHPSPINKFSLSGECLNDSMVFLMKYEPNETDPKEYPSKIYPIGYSGPTFYDTELSVFTYLYNVNSKKLTRVKMNGAADFNILKKKNYYALPDKIGSGQFQTLLIKVYENHHKLVWNDKIGKGVLPVHVLDSVFMTFFSNPLVADKVVPIQLFPKSSQHLQVAAPSRVYNFDIAQREVFNIAKNTMITNNTWETEERRLVTALRLYSVDLVSQEVSLKETIYMDSSIKNNFDPRIHGEDYTPQVVPHTYPIGMTFAPGDTFIYVVFSDYEYKKGSKFNQEMEVRRYNVIRKKWEVIPNTRIDHSSRTDYCSGYINIKLAPDGKIYLYENETGSWHGKQYGRGYMVHCINKPNATDVNKTNFKYNLFNYYDSFMKYTQPILGGEDLYEFHAKKPSSFPITSSVYKQVRYTAKNICLKNTWEFTNQCDSFYFVKYRYFFGDGDSIETTSVSEKVRHQYKNTGKYWVKLKAINSAGGHIWYGDSIVVKQNPIAKYGIESKPGCQWVAYTFTDSSTLDKDNGPFSWEWDFGYAGATKTLDSIEPIMPINGKTQHIFAQNGKFITTLIVSDSTCSDTMVKTFDVEILPASRPGITCVPTTGCTPLLLNYKRTYSDALDSIHWFLNPNGERISTNVHDKYLIEKPNNYYLIQHLYNETGCVTMDSILLDVKKGFDTGYVPNLVVASHLNNENIEVKWEQDKDAAKYALYANSTFWKNSNNNREIYTLENPISAPQEFKIIAQDQCGTASDSSNKGRTIFLTVTKQIGNYGDKETTLLQYTPYEEWLGGVSNYELQSRFKEDEEPWVSLTTTNDTQYKDEDFSIIGNFKKCYRIKANHASGIVSYSNDVCTPYTPIIFVPSSFTPNGDGLNDSWEVYHFGFKSIDLSIINRWGEVIHDKTGEKINWAPQNAPVGVYAYIIKAIDATGEEYSFKGTITVVR